MDFLPDGNSDAAATAMMKAMGEQLEGGWPTTAEEKRERLREVIEGRASAYNMFYKGLAVLESHRREQEIDYFPDPNSAEAGDFYSALGIMLEKKFLQTELHSIIGAWLSHIVLPAAREQGIVDH